MLAIFKKIINRFEIFRENLRALNYLSEIECTKYSKCPCILWIVNIIHPCSRSGADNNFLAYHALINYASKMKAYRDKSKTSRGKHDGGKNISQMRVGEVIFKTQEELEQLFISELKSLGYNPVVNESFIYAEGSVPVMLTADLYSIYNEPIEMARYLSDGKIAKSPLGICWAYSILEVAKKHRCSILLFTQYNRNESLYDRHSCAKANSFIASAIETNVNYIMGFCVIGENHSVHFNYCDNPEFTKFVCEFGFCMPTWYMDLYLDVDNLAKMLGVAGVSLCADYETKGLLLDDNASELVGSDELKTDIERIIRMVGTSSRKFNYTTSEKNTDFISDLLWWESVNKGDALMFGRHKDSFWYDDPSKYTFQ